MPWQGQMATFHENIPYNDLFVAFQKPTGSNGRYEFKKNNMSLRFHN